MDAEPITLGASLEGPPVEQIAIAITNRSGSPAPITVNCTRILGEI